ncbi:MAG: FAD-dependent oxidoreductase [Solirubrobacteraceae bacterium]|nr:FAD-dependent oxidoreductase [Solirubrobacteraceae bacterium]
MGHDVIVVGGGHNGLVAAAYLARAGKRVLVLERCEQLGGAAVSERPFAGIDARLSRYSYLVSLFPPRIARDLGIDLALRDRPVAAYAPVLRDGRAQGLLVESDPSSPATADSFRALTGGDREHRAFLELGALLAGAGRLFDTFTEPLPSRDEARALLGDEAWAELVERPLGETLDARFADGLVRGMVATDGLIGTFASLYEPSLRQNRCFLYHVVGGPWRVPSGGMGAISAALVQAARAAGAELRTGADVVAVDPAGEVTWRDASGEHSARAGRVLAGVAPAVLARLLGEEATAPEGAQIKVNLLLDRLPALRSGTDPEIAFAGTFRLHEDAAELEAAHAAAARGELPERPPAELYCHTLTDPSIADGARHTLTLFGLHAPARLFAGDETAARDTLVERYLDGLDEHLEEPIRDCLARDANGERCLEVRTPLDLERELAMPGGDIFHGDLSWPWAEDDDGDRWGVATAHERVLRCGAGTRRGGGVSGVGGHNAAMAVLGR